MPSGNDSQQLTELIRALSGNARSAAFGGGPGAMMTYQAPFPVAGADAQGGGGIISGIGQGYKDGGGGGMDKLKAIMGGMKMDRPTGFEGMNMGQFEAPSIGGAPSGDGGMMKGFYPEAASGAGGGLKAAMTPGAAGGSGMMSGLMKLFGR